MNWLDQWLDRITMYRLTLYALIGWLIIAIVYGALGMIPISPLNLGIEVFASLVTAIAGNWILAKIFHASANSESSIITALILSLIISSPNGELGPIIFATSAAMASKYFLAVGKHHVFNPAAAGAVALALLTTTGASWWVGNLPMLPWVAVGGLLIARKAQRGEMAVIFLLSLLLVATINAIFAGQNLFTTWKISLLESASIFFATVMLIEPLTSPGTKNRRRGYAIATAVLYATPQIFPQIALTPEMALALTNLGQFLLWPQFRHELTLLSKQLIAAGTYEFSFKPDEKVKYEAGQYMEWTLPHGEVDSRGNRRYFSLASAPEEPTIAIAVRYYTPPSSYKQALTAMEPGDKIIATNVAGDFVLPKDLQRPLVFIAGGIGIAPFRSMVKEIIGKNLMTDITLIYSNRKEAEIAYQELWGQAASHGVKTTYVVTEKSGRMDAEMIKRIVPDINQRTIYISGPQQLVEAGKKLVRELGIPEAQVKSDFFPGYITS